MKCVEAVASFEELKSKLIGLGPYLQYRSDPENIDMSEGGDHGGLSMSHLFNSTQ